jgi:NHL repeat
VVFIAFLLLAMPLYGVVQRRLNRDKKVLVDVGSDSVTVTMRPGEVFPIADARLGRWTPAGYGGMTKGTALHLGSGRGSFVLGGRDHRSATGTPLDAPPVDGVDAWMWAADFDELPTALGGPRKPDVHAPLAGQPTRCLLIPNPMRMISSSIFGMFKNTAAALRLNANPPQPSVAIDVGEDAISVLDLKSNALLASAPLAQVTATPAASTRSMPRMGTLTTPVLVVGVPNAQPLTIGCPDLAGPPQATWSGSTKLNYRFSWRGLVPSEQEPEFVVSDADWLTLVEKLGLTTHLEDRARADAAGAPARGGTTFARPKRKLWIYGVIIAAIMFVVVPAMMFVASTVMNHHQRKDDQLKADLERPFALPFTDLRMPHGVAVDAAGNVYVTDSCHDRVVKLAAGSSTQTVLPFKGLDSPQGVAVDSACTVYVVDYSGGQVLKLAAGSSTQTVLPSPGRGVTPAGNVTVDTAGNVYVCFSKSHYKGRSERYLLKLAPGSDAWTTLPSAPDNFSANFSTGEQDLAVDTAGNV